MNYRYRLLRNRLHLAFFNYSLIFYSCNNNFFSFSEEDEEEEVDDKTIASRLREDVLETAGKLRRFVADEYIRPESEEIKVLKSKHQKLPVTCLTVTNDGKFIYSGSKDCSIMKCKYCTKLFDMLTQGCQTHGPRAKCGPAGWP